MAENKPENKPEQAKSSEQPAKQEQKKQEQQKKDEKKEEKKERRETAAPNVTSIVRVAGKDVDGSLNIERSLDRVKGIGANLSHALAISIEAKLGINRNTNIGSLSDTQISQIESLIKDQKISGLSQYLLNRNKDMETNGIVHNVSNDLLFATRQDINRDISLKAWRGFRHQYGQKVRGQRTRSTGRTGSTVGVTKKAIQQAQKESRTTKSATGAAKEEKKPK